MEIRRAAVVAKLSALAEGGQGLAQCSGAMLRRLQAADREHGRTLGAVRQALTARGIAFDELTVRQLTPGTPGAIGAADLVVSVGGDGTLLSASHQVDRGLLLGVNSAPRDSVGHYCRAHRASFTRVLDAILTGRRKPVPVARLRLRLDGQDLAVRALNDVLVAHSCPAATTRYRLSSAGRREEHRSSGIWIATPSGSSAGIRSAGGRRLALGSKCLEYRVRELYREPGRHYALLGSVLEAGAEIRVESRMPQGQLYVDGSRLVFAFPFGSRLRARIDAAPLLLVL
jgi:NAD+ kinase